MKDQDAKKISFRQKNPTTCPICNYEFYREEMFTGSGRLIAEKLTDELRRMYKPSSKYGKIYPLAYTLTVCPDCLYTAYQKDFNDITQDEVVKLQDMKQARQDAQAKFFDRLDFQDDRDLMLGAASYMLAVDCYNFRRKNVAPTFKMGISSIRAAWLFSDLAEEFPDKMYKKLSLFFYKKAYESYIKILDLLQSGGEPAEAAGNMGPDTDRNWGYEGILYVSAVLTVKYGAAEKDTAKKIQNFNTSKKYLSRLFGAGKSSKNTPSDLLDKTRILFEKINTMVAQWEAETEEGGEGEETTV
ncbi:MAG: DUF2225 domain-containing protein [Leptospirales bacterium]|nr:DUF2225 domain-containing protein [Leptospirales bacterium]